MPARDLPNESDENAVLPDLPEIGRQDTDAENLTGVQGDLVRDGDSERVTLAEETLEPRVVRKQIGEVVIHKSIESQTLRNEVDLEREHVAIEQLVVEEYVDEKREPWYEDDVLVIPVYEEVLVTERKLMLTKLVRVRHEVRVEQAVVEGEVRREVLDVEPRSTGE
ncbi:MAG: YsnF/AvaK domain-containing protein [Chloroflexota bacterium]|nr:YsnF/AvaK domain-containing protein [Chloroflexota bacterium]